MDFSEIFKATRTKTNKLEKPAGNITVDVRESASAEDNNEKQQEENHEHVQWETGFWKRFPWIGALAILTMLVCIAMDGVILGTSNGQYQQQWPAHQQWDMLSEKWKKKTQVAPHVLLAIVNTITNVALAIAIGHGVAIAWWRRVLKGSTIEAGYSIR
jgi:ABC-type phosphate transport system permease subunit